jgi:alpha-tubulin suppressor-like RCC1 family protein
VAGVKLTPPGQRGRGGGKSSNRRLPESAGSAFLLRMLSRRSPGFVDRKVFAIAGWVLAWLAFAGVARAQVPVITAISAPRQVVTINQNLTLSVTATGATSYQWKRNGFPVSGATNANYAITGAISYRDNGWYQAIATNGSGSTTSAVVFVNVVVAPARIVGSGRVNFGQAVIPEGLNNVATVASGTDFGLALKGDGTVASWGGPTGLINHGQTMVPSGLSGVVKIAAGGFHGLALKSDGTVAAWGGANSIFLDFGQGRVPGGLSGVVAIAGGDYHSLAVKSDGTVTTWGRNPYGDTTAPAGLVGVVAVAAGFAHCLALKSDGTVVAWGRNFDGETTVPSGLNGVVAVAAGANHSLALKGDGTVVAWGSNSFGQTTVPSGLSGVVAVAGGDYHSVALKNDGTTVAWGPSNTISPGAAGAVSMVSVSARSGFALFLTNGPPLAAAIRVPSKIMTATAAVNFTPVTAVAGTAPYSYAIAPALPAGLTFDVSTGAIYGVPLASSGTASFTVTVTDAVAATTTGAFTLSVNSLPVFVAVPAPAQVVAVNQSLTLTVRALRATSYQWKRNSVPIPGANDATYLINGAMLVPDTGWYQVVASNSEGSTTSTVIFVNVTVDSSQIVTDEHFAYGYGSERIPNGIRSVAGIAPGGIYALWLASDGTVAGSGYNGNGQITIPNGLNGVVAVAAGGAASLALKSDGTVVGWGYGQSTIPAGLSDVVAVAGGGRHSLALKSDGTVVGWGSNDFGETRIPNGLAGVVAVAAGFEHSLALKSDGSVIAWGDNSKGQSSVPRGLNNVVAVAAGTQYSVALKSDGTLVAWGLVEPRLPSNLSGMSTGAALNLFVRATQSVPSIISMPTNRSAGVGESATLTVAATGSGPLSYQWRKDGVLINGATGGSYLLGNVQASGSGVYSVTVNNTAGQATAAITTLTVTPLAAPSSRLANVSVRSSAGTGDQTLIVGLAIGGGAKLVLLRGIGPGLAQFGLGGTLADPQMRLFNSAGAQTHLNDDWGGGATLMTAFAASGAFGLPLASKDAALFVPLGVGAYSAQVTSSGSAGTALVEAYDFDGPTTASRLINLSVRTQVGTGENILIVGFVVEGNAPKQILLRAVGPGLAQFGVGGVLADPRLSLFSSGVSTATQVNDNWGGSAALSAAFTATGAFGLASVSKDAALLVTLQPGAYTAQVSGVGDTTGVALVEVYEVP